MIHWFYSLSLVQHLWVGYALLLGLGFLFALAVEKGPAKDVGGAPGWMMFGWICISVLGTMLLGLFTLIHWIFYR